MTRYFVFLAVACMAASAAMALYGDTVSLPLLLIEGLVTLSVVQIHMTGGLSGARLFELPVFVTVLIAFSYGIVPLQALLMPEKLNGRLQGSYDLIMHALLLVILGMIAFWTGCKVVHRRPRGKVGLLKGGRSLQSTLMVALVVYAVGFACKVYLLQHQLFAYTASLQLYRNNLAGAQWFMFGTTFSTLGFLLICIEWLSSSSSRAVKWLFWIILLSESWWGLVSGMKEAFLMDFLAMSAIATVYRGKLVKTWLLSAVLGLVVLYPLFEAYRTVVRGSGSSQVSGFSDAFTALKQAVTQFSESSAYDEWIGNGTDLTMSRLDSLQGAALILSLPNRAEEIRGEERLWMIPFYPFVPRLLWPSKPILDKGARFNRVLGGNGDSSSAISYIADCYTFGGVLGTVAGMLALGMFLQRYTNGVQGVFSKTSLFRYSVILLFSYKIDIGLFEWWSLILKTMLVTCVVEWMAYGSSDKPMTRLALRAAVSPNSRVDHPRCAPAGFGRDIEVA